MDYHFRSKREFKIEDKVLVISEEMDQFNSYLMKFRALASECTDELIKECTKKINNLLTLRIFKSKRIVLINE